MRIGILGSGLMGGKLGTLFAHAGHEVVFSYARSMQKLKRMAKDAGGKARAGIPREAAQDADAILLAVHWLRMDDVLSQAGDLAGKVILTCSLPMNDHNTELVIGHTTSGAEELQRKSRTRTSWPLSIRFPAKCCSVCTKQGAEATAPVWSTAGITRPAKVSPRSSSATQASNRWMQASCALPDISSRSHCSSASSRMEAPAGRNWRIGSKSLSNETKDAVNKRSGKKTAAGSDVTRQNASREIGRP
jgi:hypothetical protein